MLTISAFTGRVIVVDWAVPKDKFHLVRQPPQPKPEIKDEPNDEEPKAEPLSDDDDGKSELEDDDSVKSQPISETDSIKSETESSDEESESEGSIDNEDYIPIRKDNEIKTDGSVTSEIPWPKPSHDINEGKTVFLKNVPFDITNDELRAFLVEQIGPVYFAVVCIDRLTEHSRGTAFVKFKVSKYFDKKIIFSSYEDEFC